MSLAPLARPRHKIRAFHSVAQKPSGAEYKRLLNYLAENATRHKQLILDDCHRARYLPTRANSRRNLQRPEPSQTTTEPAIDDSENYIKQIPVENHVGTIGGRSESEFLEYARTLLDQWFSASTEKETESEPEIEPEKKTSKFEDISGDISEENAESSTDKHKLVFSEGKEVDPVKALLARLENSTKTSALEPLTSFTSRQNSKIAETSSSTAKKRFRPQKALNRPRIIQIAAARDGGRLEKFDNGTTILKNAIGKVVQIHSSSGECILFTYCKKGFLESFTRLDQDGRTHSRGTRDKDGVVVRASDGRVKAQGESMSVDSRGCLTVRRFDGQFWSLDLLNRIHIERRILQDTNGIWSSMTALLTDDGFRIMTRFQKLRDEYRPYGDWLSPAMSSLFRFYGRDGSVVQFDNDDDLAKNRPSSLWPAGTREIDNEWRGARRTATAWDSLNLYMSSLLSKA